MIEGNISTRELGIQSPTGRADQVGIFIVRLIWRKNLFPFQLRVDRRECSAHLWCRIRFAKCDEIGLSSVKVGWMVRVRELNLEDALGLFRSRGKGDDRH